MIPTPSGISLAVHARRILAELSKMIDDVRSLEGEASGLACIGGLAYSRTALLPDAIKLALARHPGMQVRTVEGPIETLLAELHCGKIDVVICAYPDRSLLDGIDVEPITSDPMGLFVWKNHPLAARHGLHLGDLAAYPFILPPAGSITRTLLERFFRDGGGPRPTGRTETSSYSMVRNLLLGTEHIAFRSLREFATRAESADIVTLDMDIALPSRKICLLQRHGVRHTAAVRDFLKVVREVAGDGTQPRPRRPDAVA
jgi:LysR family transcriptional regulator of gallate degradation